MSKMEIDFSTIPLFWNDDDIVVSDVMSKGSEEIQAAKENGGKNLICDYIYVMTNLLLMFHD